MRDLIIRYRADEDGATAIEYGLIVALICVGIIAALTVFGNEVQALFGMIATEYRNATT